jgi:2-aminoethylphosphonate transport system substrate-binding protein
MATLKVLVRLAAVTAATVTVVAGATACGGTGTTSSTKAAGGGAKTVTVYSADGLADWYTKQFQAFEAKTGIKVQYVEAGSGEVVSRMEKEKPNPQADVVVTLPPFIQKAAAGGLLQAASVPGADHVPTGDKDPDGRYLALVDNYLCFIYNPSANPAPTTWDDLLAARFKGKIQYSTPGQAGDGTAVLIQLQHVLGEQHALDYLKKLQNNNVGPSSSTGKLQPKVSNGEILVANGDVQMNLASINNDKSNFKIFFPADASGKKSTFALPYDMGLAAGAPHADAGKKLMEFLLSPDAQQAVNKDAYGIPARSDVTPTDANFQAVKAALDGVDVWNPDWTAISSNLDTQVAAYNKALGLS